MTIRYIRNASIIYLSLMPSLIMIRRGQHVKLFNFTNSYHPNLSPNPNFSVKCFFPFVVSINDHLD
jgi:hypothetical protein